MDKGKKPSGAISDSMDSTNQIPLNSSNFGYGINGSSFSDFNPNTDYQNLLIKSTTISRTSQGMKFSNHTSIGSTSSQYLHQHNLSWNQVVTRYENHLNAHTENQIDGFQNHMQSSQMHTLDDQLLSSSIGSSSSPDSPLGYHPNRRVLPCNPIIGSSLEGSHAYSTTSQSMSTDSGNEPSNDSSNENGFAEWGSTSGTSFLKEFEDNDELLNVFNNINHIKPPDLVFPMQETSSDPALSAPADPPGTPAAPPNLMALSPRTRELLPTEMIEELDRTDPGLARRMIINRKAAHKAKDKKRRYMLELEGRMHILQTKSNAYKYELIMLEKKKDALQNEQDIMGKRLKCIVGEVQQQDKINQKVSEDVQNLREVLGLKPTDDVMQLARRMILALNHQTQPSANSSARQREMLWLVEQFLWLQDQAPDQQKSSHYQASQLMGTLGTAQLRKFQDLNQQPRSLHQPPQLIQYSSTATQHIPIQLQPHSSHLTMYNTRRNNNQSSSSTRVYAQEHRYRLNQLDRRQPLLRLPNQQGQIQQQQNAPPTQQGQSDNNNNNSSSNMNSQQQN